jgi:hypothetical protein
MAHQAYIQ